MKNIKILFVLGAGWIFIGNTSFAADKKVLIEKSTTTANVNMGFPNDAKEDVKNYKSFLEYNKKHAIVRTDDLGEIQLDKDGIKFSAKNIRAFGKNSIGEKKEIGSLSTDKRHVGVYNLRDESFSVLDGTGKEIRKNTFSKSPKGVNSAFSDTRIFIISPSFDGSGGFEMFTSTGGFLKWLNVEDVEGYAVSNTNEYFGVTTIGRNLHYFRLFNMEGNELWKQPIVPGWNAQIEFSPDDRFVSIKIPKYWIKAKETDPSETLRKTNKLYLVDVKNRRIVSEEDYAD